MCGLAGYFSINTPPDREILKRMAHAIRHRGPDDAGQWTDVESGIGLAHCRLSIQDLSSAGHQPMVSPSGRYVIVYNGEVYNHLLIRKDIDSIRQSTIKENVRWRGHTDTETLLAGFDTWDVETTIKKCNGMFAFALWDKKERHLMLCRDRMGEKPLYYGWNQGTFLFSSELKAFKKFPGFRGEINRDAVTLYLRHNYIPAPLSIYKGIFKLWPGSILTLHRDMTFACPWDNNGPSWGELKQSGLSIQHYWSFPTVVENGIKQPFLGTEDDAVNALEQKISDAIQRQQISDVPLGAFLSGGIDSSLIVALMQAKSTEKIKTFTIGFHEEKYNEAIFAKAVAQHIGTAHTELYVSPDDARAVIPMLPTIYDEPFSDSSQIPTFLVSRLTKKFVTVSLSGDAGDELFGGYSRYFKSISILKRMGWVPYPARKMIARLIHSCRPQISELGSRPLKYLLPSKYNPNGLNHRMNTVAEILLLKGNEDLYRRFVSHWNKPGDIVIGAEEPFSIFNNKGVITQPLDFGSSMMLLDSLNYLPDDILVKVDRAAMAVSLETRVPFLDHNVVEFAWRLPFSYKMRNNEGKWILRKILDKYLPRTLIERPKKGFGVPIDSWLRGPLRDWAESLLNEERIKNENVFEAGPIRKKWTEHQSGLNDWQHYLWDILIFQAWFENERSEEV